LVILVSRLPVEIGAGPQRWSALELLLEHHVPTASPEIAGGWLIGSFESLVRTIATAFGYSFFWCQVAAIYLLLRRDVDQTEFDEVFVEREDRRYELPELQPMVAMTGAGSGTPGPSNDKTTQQTEP
jgi:hypothetical protein